MDDQQHKPPAWHTKTASEVMDDLHTEPRGLTEQEAQRRLERYGPNQLHQQAKKTVWKMLWEQLADAMVLILIGAAVLSIFLGEWAEAIVIFTIVVLDAVIGVIQENKAVNALNSLKKMSAPTATVRRDGEESVIPACDLVPGDIVLIEDGSIVPADVRLIEENRLAMEEASLTGESQASEKDSETVLPEDTYQEFLRNTGYTDTDLDGLLAQLACRLETQPKFPHEIENILKIF